MPVTNLPVATHICPACHFADGAAINAKCEKGYTTVTYQCPTCQHPWSFTRRDTPT
jgi:hypothetical protein